MSRCVESESHSPFPSRDAALNRRRFLARIGLLVGAGALAPLIARRTPGPLATLHAGRPALGTWMRVVARHRDRHVAEGAIAAAFKAVREVDAQMSVHRADSELSRVNAAAGRDATPVGGALLAVVSAACTAARRTGGVYDPTVLPLMRLYGFYGAKRDRPPSAREVDAALSRMGIAEVATTPGTLGLAHEGAGLDLGSIGKGWAVDRAVAAMVANGVQSGLVDLGGNVFGLGTPDDRTPGWSVGVFHPVSGTLERTFVLRNAAVATSGNSEQTHMLGPVRIGHLFDARRGTPANGHLSASVMAASGIESDVGSTVAFLLGPDRFAGWPGALDVHFTG
jgi:thiamine biosynthesis lipoprotein